MPLNAERVAEIERLPNACRPTTDELRELLAAWRELHDPTVIKFKSDGRTLVNLDPITFEAVDGPHRLFDANGVTMRLAIECAALDALK